MLRRFLLAALPISAIGVTLGFNAPAGPVLQPTHAEPSPELLALIAAHRSAWEAFGETCDMADRCSENYRGEEGHKLHDAANAEEERAMAAVMSYPAYRRPDLHAKGKYLRWVEDNCGGIASYADALIEAMTNA